MTAPDPSMITQMLVAALRHYKVKYARSLLAIVAARVCDEMNIDRQSFCTRVLEEPKKNKDKE